LQCALNTCYHITLEFVPFNRHIELECNDGNCTLTTVAPVLPLAMQC
jgi:hypothetical protein